MKREEVFEVYKPSENVRKINKLKINCYDLGGTVEGAERFNEVYRLLVKECPYELRRIKRTPSGGIHIMANIQLRYDICSKGNGVELIYLGKEGSLRFLFNLRKEGISGSQAFYQFKKICKAHDIDIEEFGIENGEEVKEQIEKPMIKFFGVKDRIYLGVHHLDINSSYMAGIAKYQPEMAEVIQEIYSKRKSDNTMYKDILTHTYGFCQSEWCKINDHKYALAHWSRAAVEFNNRMIEDLTKKIQAAGGYIVAFNTDGIWYKGEVYHDENEGKELGQWKNDHVDCKIRFKSKGAYEFIEDGIYHPVIRGRTKYDRIKPREEWEWGDIYKENTKIIKFTFSEEEGIIIDDEEIGGELEWLE